MAEPLSIAIGVSAALSFLGNLFTGWAQGKVSEKQLELARQQLGLSKEQFEFMKQQALRQNRIQERNVQAVSPLLMDALYRSRTNIRTAPQVQRVRVPNMNNPYQAGVGRWGGPMNEVAGGLPWLDYGGSPPAASSAQSASARATVPSTTSTPAPISIGQISNRLWEDPRLLAFMSASARR